MNLKRVFGAVLMALFVAGASLPSFAQSSDTPKIDRRQKRQERRIREGVRTGTLTRHEQKKMERREARIRASETAAKSDGVVTKQERRHLNRELKRTGRAIKRQKSDTQYRRQ